MEVSGENGGVIEVVNGYEVRQHFNPHVGRWYVWLPKHSGLREQFKKRDRMLRSHYVFCRMSGFPYISKSFVIHHIDHDRTNDSYENLQMLSVGDHNEIHESDDPQRNFLGRKHLPESIEKMREIASTRGNNGVWNGAKVEHFESTKEKMSEKATGRNNAMYRHDLDDEAIVRCFDQLRNLGAVARIFGCSIQAVRSRITKRGETTSNWKSMSDKELLAVFQECGGNISAMSLKLNAPQTSLWRKMKKVEATNAGN